MNAAIDLDTTKEKLRAAATERDLELCAQILNSAEFDKLPPGAREDLATLYAERLFHITGALVG